MILQDVDEKLSIIIDSNVIYKLNVRPMLVVSNLIVEDSVFPKSFLRSQ